MGNFSFLGWIKENKKIYKERGLKALIKEKGWVVCERTENSIMASSSSDGCT